MTGKLNRIWELMRITLQEWNKDDAAQLAAAIAYYTIFSIPPLLIIATAITGYFFNTDSAQNQLIGQIGGFIGPESADFMKSLLGNAARSSDGPVASFISVIVLLLGASGVFLEVQYALNKIWNVSPARKRNFLIITLINRLRSFLMLLGIGILALFFLILNSVISVVIGTIPGGAQNMLLPAILNFLVLFGMITVGFALIFRIVPDKEITWKDVRLGALVTGLLFMLGKYAINFYLTFNNSGSAFGAAGSLIVILIWIYYSAQIFLLGAEFTQVYARIFGSQRNANNTILNPKIPPQTETLS